MLQNKLALLAVDPKNIGRLCDMIGDMPNIDFPTMGGTVFWNTLESSNGWKLQKNKLTSHCRIIDPSNVRRAWGSESVMIDALNRLQPAQPKNETILVGNNNTTTTGNLVFCPSCGVKVPDGNFCKKCGANMN